MSGCSCIVVYVEDGFDDYGHEWRVAGGEHECVECHRIIELGERYEWSWGAYARGRLRDNKMYIYRTCIDCKSVRDAFFCEGWSYGRIWGDVEEHIGEACGDGSSLSSDCLASLTPAARDDVFSLIEDVWKDMDEED